MMGFSEPAGGVRLWALLGWPLDADLIPIKRRGDGGNGGEATHDVMDQPLKSSGRLRWVTSPRCRRTDYLRWNGLVSAG